MARGRSTSGRPSGGECCRTASVYVDSWIDESLERCFQIMETDDPGLFDEWIANQSDLGEFEVVSVIGSAEAAGRALG